MTEIIEQSSPQAIVLIVDSFIDDGVTEDEALAVVVSSIALQAITEDQAHEIFAELNTDALSDAEVIQVIESVQEAPEEIRNQFEDTIDIFSEGVFDTYIPVGSSITVGQRRAIIAVSAVTSVIASAPVSGGSQRRRGTK